MARHPSADLRRRREPVTVAIAGLVLALYASACGDAEPQPEQVSASERGGGEGAAEQPDVGGRQLTSTEPALEDDPPTYARAADLVASSWLLDNIEMPGPDRLIPVAGFPITLTFADNTFEGTAGCNRYGAGWAVDGVAFTTTPADSTGEGCTDEVDRIESTYLDILARADQAHVMADTLVIFSAAGANEGVEPGPTSALVFRRDTGVPWGEIIDRDWSLVAYADAGTEQPINHGEYLLALSSADGLRVTTPCGEIAGAFTITGRRVETNLDGSGVEDCSPVERSAHEMIELVIGKGFDADLRPDHLTITTGGGGNEVLHFAPSDGPG